MSVKLGIITILDLPPASLGHIATSSSSPSILFLAEQAVLCLRPRRREEAQK
jgi:hypothetical protein